MKYSNLAWRIEPFDEPEKGQPVQLAVDELEAVAPKRMNPRPRFERRTIEIRDQGLAPFRIR
jgi:hypothetical protein